MASASDNFQSCEAMFDKIVQSANEYSTDEIQDWGFIKSDVMEILTTHRPTKIADQQYGLSCSLDENQRLIVSEFEDKAFVREYNMLYRRCCDCSKSSFIDEYGIIFVEKEHKCKPRLYSDVMKKQEQLKEKKLLEPQNNLPNRSVARTTKNSTNGRSCFEEIDFDDLLKSLKDYTNEEVDLSSKEEILGLLKTHRPVKNSCYQYGISKDGVRDESIFIFDPLDKFRTYEYSKFDAPETMDSTWPCSKSFKHKCPPLIWKCGIVFTPIKHFCTSKKITKELSKRMQTRKSYGIAQANESLVGTSSDSNHSVASRSNISSTSPVQGVVNLNNDFATENGSPSNTVKKLPINARDDYEKPPRLSRYDASTPLSVLPEAELPYDNDDLDYPVHNENDSTTDMASHNNNQGTVMSNFASLNQSVAAENNSLSDLPGSFRDSLSKDVAPDNNNPSSSSSLKRNRTAVDDDDFEKLIFVDVKPPLSKKAKSTNVLSILETTSSAVNKEAEEDECVIIDQKAEIISHSIHLEVPYQFDHPSTSTLKAICKKLCIDYNHNAYTFWGNIKFDQISSASTNLNLHAFKTKNIYECLSLLFTGGTEQYYKIQHTLNQAFQEQLLNSGKMSQREIDQIFMTSTVSDAQLAFVTNFLGCRIAIFKKSSLSGYGNWDSDSTVLTLILSFLNGVFSVVLNL